ncbi:hypothetical protein BDF21DRAFT_351371 [Thamnidium elegans]|uniref:Uncharacterized protein n=1 Tax=Thamnidium elegans TaxID=101142 RepID=A0A8H7SV94_9FUNG|nr:hypothetical protein INT48_008944 [Thamnidium elegans]KAI8049399.1 hypothetical protein BDF21DRAFT_351371 [Thamnidium elegans]
MKPDTIEDDNDDIPIIFTQKPDTKDEAIAYDKPNTYDEDQDYKRPSLPQEVLDDLIVRAEFIDGKRAPIKTNDDDDTSSKFTSSLLSHIPSSTTGLTSSPPISLSPSVSTVSSNSNSSTISTATTRLALLKILKSKPMEDLIAFDLRKYSFTRPHEHDVYIKGTKEQVYKKVQPHSYSWGFQNILYKVTDGKIKVAEARRKAFKKEITVEWGDFPILVGPETFNDENDDDTSSVVSTVTNTKSNQLYNKTNSHLLFTYETEFEGFKIRWKRASLLSHDMICEVRLEQKKKWHVIAEFDSHRMGYFVHLGEVIIDKNALKLVDRTDHFEAHIIITCCTLIDLMREVVEKAVGLSKGGVVGSDK